MLVGDPPRLRQRGGVIALDPLGRVHQRRPHRRLDLRARRPRARPARWPGRPRRPGGTDRSGPCTRAPRRRRARGRRRRSRRRRARPRPARPRAAGRRPGRRPPPRARARRAFSWSEVREAGSGRGWPVRSGWLRLRNFAIRSLMAAYSVFMAARLTMRRAVERVISATSTRPLARRVSPDCTRSTMRSARPTSGASSMEPSRCTISTWTPRAEKYCSVRRGYFVATRTHDHFAGSSRSHSSRGSATTSRHTPKPRSSGSYTSGSCSSRMSLPTMPRWAAP